MLAGQITALADLCFFPAVMNHRLSQKQLQGIFREVFARHLDKLEAVAARERIEPAFDVEASRSADRAAGWAYRLLETRGGKAAVDERSRETMSVDGMSESDIAEVEAVLATMQRQNLAAERPDQLSEMVRRAGGEANPMNLALAQEAVYRAMAEANFLTARRYDGARAESSALLADILSERAIGGSRDVSRGDVSAPARAETNAESEAPRHREEPEPVAEARAAPRANTSGTAERGDVDGRVQPGGAPANAPPEPAPAPAKTASLKLDEHPIVVSGEKLIARNQLNGVWDTKTLKQARQTYHLFGKLLIEQGVVRVEALAQRHFAELADLLSEVATSYGKSAKDDQRSTAELRAIGASKPPPERGVKPETLNRHLTFLGQLLAYLKGQGFKLDRDIDLSLLRGKTRHTRGRAKRATFSGDELKAIFELACFTGCAGWKGDEAFAPGPELYHRALYFATILLYYTGARREEICGLAVDDVQSPELEIGGEKKRTPCILIHDNGVRRLKNAQSMRLVALVPEIVRLGFLDYVAEIRRLGYKLVFPDLKSPTSKSPLGDRLYDELKRGLDQVVPDASARNKVLHSFRKTFGDSLKQAGVTAEIRGDILGHGGETVTEEIYCDPIAVSSMLEHLAKLPIVTGHLVPRAICLIP